jgi:glutamate dehydrogenase
MVGAIGELLRRLGLWFVVQPLAGGVGETVSAYRSGFAALKGRFSQLVSPLEKNAVEAKIGTLRGEGVPGDVAEDVAILPLLAAVPEIVLLAGEHKVAAEHAARLYFGMGALVGLDRLRGLAGRIVAADHWDRLALRRIVDDLYSAQRLLAADAVRRGQNHSEALASWAQIHRADIERTTSFLSELAAEGEASVAKLALANSQIQKLASAIS